MYQPGSKPASAVCCIEAGETTSPHSNGSVPFVAVERRQLVEPPALLAEALQLVVLHEAAQLQVLLADAVALIVLLLLPDVLLAALHLSA